MDQVRLGRTGLKVSRLCLGTMQFGWTADREASFAVLDAFVEGGGTFLDTADIYSRWAPGNPGGVAERILGDWMAERGNRHQLVLATKVRGRMGEGPNDQGLSRAHILRAVEGSLARLRTDRIDLYQSHWFDRRTPIEETMGAFDDLVRRGLVRYVGASNIPAWRLARALWASDLAGWARYDALQPHYNLVHRAEYERDLAELVAEEGLGVLPYSPLAAGFLTGKYRPGAPLPASDRAARIQATRMTEPQLAVVATLEELGRERGATPAQMALAWLLAKPQVASPVLGANSPAQLAELLPAAALHLGPDEVERLDQVSAWR
jgi:aryl-alcohol dehydrogenase-like predicted oxidoreductase